MITNRRVGRRDNDTSVVPEYGQNGDKSKRQKSKRQHQNGDNTKRRQAKGNITETATKTCGQNGDKGQKNAYRKFTLWSTRRHDSGYLGNTHVND